MNGDGPLASVLVTHYFPGKGGGIELVADELARRIDGAAVARQVWFASDTHAPPALAGIEYRPMRTWNFFERRCGFPWPIWHPSCVAKLWRSIGEAQLVHLHDTLYMGNVLAACIAHLRRKPLLVTQHVGLVPYRNPLLRALMKLANRCIARPILRRADRIVFISAAVMAYYGRFCSWSAQPLLVPNGVDTRLYRLPTSHERRLARAAARVEDGGKVFIFVGRFVEKKGMRLLAQLAAAMTASEWIFVGDGPTDPEAWGLPNVRVYRGRSRETLRELLWAADLLVLPSVGEGFPLVVQEAMACGVACFASEDALEGYPAVKRLALHEGLGPGALQRWSTRLHRVWSGTERLPDPAALAQFARQNWSWEAAASVYTREYRDLAARAGTRP